MYTLVLVLHSWLRWAALVAGVAATVTAFSDRSKTLAQGRSDMWALVAMSLLDLQMLLGLVLYLVLSPNTRAIFDNFAATMRDPAARFFAVEHVTLMLAAVVLAHLGRVLARKAKTAESKRSRMLICFGLATILMIIGIPWPGMASGRPLFRV
jgi:uncharacterized membrane protein HdeD (DUF308 family)